MKAKARLARQGGLSSYVVVGLVLGVLVLGLLGCRPRVMSVEEAWVELNVGDPFGSARKTAERLELVEAILQAGVDQTGNPLAVPLGLVELMDALAEKTAPDGSESLSAFDSLQSEFEDRLEYLGSGVAAPVELDRKSIKAGSRAVLRQTIDLTSARASAGQEEPALIQRLWIAQGIPSFVQRLRFDTAEVGNAFELRVVNGDGTIQRLPGRSFRAGSVGPPGTLFEIPSGSRRLELVYGRIELGTSARGLLMPVVSSPIRLPVWLGRSEKALFLQATPVLEVEPGPRAGVVMRAPSVVLLGEEFSLMVQFIDTCGNASDGDHSAFVVSLGAATVSSFPRGRGSNLHIGDVSVLETGVSRFRLESSEGLVAWSNPVLVVAKPSGRVFWNDPKTGLEIEGVRGNGRGPRSTLAAVWGMGPDMPTVDEEIGAGGIYTTTGARILARCVAPKGPRPARCLINGTAPLSRIRIMADGAVPLRDERPLETSSASGLVELRWELSELDRPTSQTNAALPLLWQGTVTTSRGEWSSAVLHGLEVAREGGGKGVFGFEVMATRSSGILLRGRGVQDGRLNIELLRLGLTEEESRLGATKKAAIDLRTLPHREETAWGFLEARWLREEPLLDLDLQWPRLTEDEAATARVIVEQVDGQVASVPFAASLFGGLEAQ